MSWIATTILAIQNKFVQKRGIHSTLYELTKTLLLYIGYQENQRTWFQFMISEQLSSTIIKKSMEMTKEKSVATSMNGVVYLRRNIKNA